ncbi:MAG: hypothetical protein WD010_09985 [Nitriliruptor sp.]
MEHRRIRRTLTVLDDFAEADRRDREYWHALTPRDRLRHLDELRRTNYGDDAAAGRLQRVLEVARLPRG